MILSNECYLKDTCKKFRNGNCDINQPTFCSKLFKLNYLYDEALLSNNQRTKVALRVDADGTDRAEFIQLKEIEKNKEISRFVFEILFGTPNQQFFKMIMDSKEDLSELVEWKNGNIQLYDFLFYKQKIA